MGHWKNSKIESPAEKGNYLAQRVHGLAGTILEYQVCYYNGKYWDAGGGIDISKEIVLWRIFKRPSAPPGSHEKIGIELHYD